MEAIRFSRKKPTKPGVYFCRERRRHDCDGFQISRDLALAIVRPGLKGVLYVTVIWEDVQRPCVPLAEADWIQFWAGPIPLPGPEVDCDIP